MKNLAADFKADLKSSLSSHDRVESVVEPLHSEFHRLPEGVVLCGAFLCVANGLRKQQKDNGKIFFFLKKEDTFSI